MSSQSKIAAALGVARKTRVLKADGGDFSNSQRLADPPVLDQLPSIPTLPVASPKKSGPHLHTGPIHSPVSGRTDHLPVNVPSGSYILPADIVSGMGEGNSVSGFKQIKKMFEHLSRVYGGVPYGGSGMPYGQNTLPYGGHAKGGSANSTGEPVPVLLAGGEFGVAPHEVQWAGDGSIEDGHAALDDFVKQYRAKTINTLKNLPGPRRD
jgi:hypothetical protein